MGASDPFIEPPIPSIKPPSSVSNFIQSPVKRLKTASKLDDLITPAPRAAKASSPDFIAPHKPVLKIKRRSRKGVAVLRKPPKTHESANVSPPTMQDDNVEFTDCGGFELSNWSPPKAKDNIDWSIIPDDLKRLKVDFLPRYWEQLSTSLNGIVRVTARLYIIQDCNKQGYLKV